MKAFKFLALVAVAASFSAPAHAERYTIAVRTANGSIITSFGALDTPGGYCSDGSRIESLRLCNRNLYAYEKVLMRARNAMVKNQGFFEVRYGDRAGYPKAC